MEMTQVQEIVNAATKEAVGSEVIAGKDFNQIVDIGKNVIDSKNVDNYVKSLIDHIGKVVFVNRYVVCGHLLRWQMPFHYLYFLHGWNSCSNKNMDFGEL